MATKTCHFGWAFINIGSTLMGTYSAAPFIRSYYLTPPYPSCMNLQYSVLPGDNGFLTNSSKYGYLEDMLDEIAKHKRITMGINIAFDILNPTTFGEVDGWLDAIEAHAAAPQIPFIGFSWEQVTHILDPNPTPTESDTAMDDLETKVSARTIGGGPGRVISYYPQGFSGTKENYQWFKHINWPDGDHQGLLTGTNTFEYGITCGEDGERIFPSWGCSTPGQAQPSWNLVSFSEGYLPSYATGDMSPCDNLVSGETNDGFIAPSIVRILEDTMTVAAARREFLFFIAGNNAVNYTDGAGNQKSFTGVSGVNTVRLFDHPSFRKEIQDWLKVNQSTHIYKQCDLQG